MCCTPLDCHQAEIRRLSKCHPLAPFSWSVAAFRWQICFCRKPFGRIWALNSLKWDKFISNTLGIAVVMCDFSSACASQIRRKMLFVVSRSVHQSSSLKICTPPIFLCLLRSPSHLQSLFFFLPLFHHVSFVHFTLLPKCKCSKPEKSVWSSVIGCAGWRCSQSIMPRRSLTNSFCVPHALLLYHRAACTNL